MMKSIGNILLLMILCFGLQAQSKEQLEKERLKIIKDIEATNKFLQSAKKDKESTLKEVKTLEVQVDNRKKLITNIKTEISSSDQVILDNNQKIDSLLRLRDKLKSQYADLLRYNYRQELSNSKWTYLLSAQNINTFLLRWRYLHQFTAFQIQKGKEIADLNDLIKAKNTDIEKVKQSKAQLLVLEETTFKQLESDKKNKDVVLKTLSSKETDLQKQLKAKQAEREKLNSAIERIIMEQMRAAKSETTASAGNKEEKFDTESAKLAADFTKNKGKLPWPVSSGFVSGKFGTQAHPTLRGVTIENNGIDISSNAQQTVSAVFGGEVVGASKIPGYKNMIIIKHGTYYSVYSNMENVNVGRGDKINVGQKIGVSGLEDDGTSELHFELWKDKAKQNPESWLKRR
ncbi:MAG: peptidoglycan DD-metalloendopeptidase family protein [Saprospiraceae bacterium]|nr:peptidoglycan DD-metalloendopeptidase family protein [Saprospiraceae bacterium]